MEPASSIPDPRPPRPAPSPQVFVNILGVVYLHQRTPEGGDLYLTPFGLACLEHLQLGNWFDPEWFTTHRQRLEGTSAVYRVPTRPVDGRSMDLVVKYCRVGEDVPLNTHTLSEFINAEFNSPWEEFALVMELRERALGGTGQPVDAQEPLAIHVPPDHLQLWQSGRSEDRIDRLQRRHPGVALDILRQYQLVYAWIPGRNLVEALLDAGRPRDGLGDFPWRMNERVLDHLRGAGFVVADMKPVHIIFRDEALRAIGADPARAEAAIAGLVEQGRYAVVDYELLQRTPEHDAETNQRRRRTYLDHLRGRFQPTPLPPHLHPEEILGVPFLHGRVESTGGELWVIGRNAGLFDFFLPERWRRTTSAPLSQDNDVHYTLTKDHVHLVWKVSRVGELPEEPAAAERGFNSPFEECAIAFLAAAAGIPTTNPRAIYRTGSRKLEASGDLRRYHSHEPLRACDGAAILRHDHNYILISGYYNGPEAEAGQPEPQRTAAIDLARAVAEGYLDAALAERLAADVRRRLRVAELDGDLLGPRDLVASLAPDGRLVATADGLPEVRICDFSLITRR